MIRGITVVLINRTQTGTDAFNKPIYSETRINVENVLVSPSLEASSDVISDQNLEGRKSVYTLGIPKGDNHVWEDQDVEFFGKRFHVFSSQVKGIDDLIPLQWNSKVMVELYE